MAESETYLNKISMLMFGFQAGIQDKPVTQM